MKKSRSYIGSGRRWANKIGSRSGSRGETIRRSGGWRYEFGEQLVNFRSDSIDGSHQGLSAVALSLIWEHHRRSIYRRGCARLVGLYVGQSGMLSGWRRPIQIIRIWLALAYEGHQSSKSIQLGVEISRETCTRRSMVSDNGSCCSESEPKNQNMTVSCGPLSGF